MRTLNICSEEEDLMKLSVNYSCYPLLYFTMRKDEQDSAM